MSYSYVLKLNSRDSNYKNITTNPIQIDLGNSGNSIVQRIVIKGASIPHVFYNVNATNNILKFRDSESHYTFTWPVGQYTITSFINAFNNEFTGSIGLTCSLNQLTNKLEFLSGYRTYTFESNGSTCFSIIGLRPTEDFFMVNTAPLGNSLLFMPDLSGIRNVYIETNFSSMHCLDSKGFHSYGGFVPVDVPFGSIIHYINQEANLNDINRSKVYSQNLSKVEVILRDVNGNILDLQNQPFELTFHIIAAHTQDL